MARNAPRPEPSTKTASCCRARCCWAPPRSCWPSANPVGPSLPACCRSTSTTSRRRSSAPLHAARGSSRGPPISSAPSSPASKTRTRTSGGSGSTARWSGTRPRTPSPGTATPRPRAGARSLRTRLHPRHDHRGDVDAVGSGVVETVFPQMRRGQLLQVRHRWAYSPSAASSSSWLPNSAIRPSITTAMRSASCAVCRRCAMATTVRSASSAPIEPSR